MQPTLQRILEHDNPWLLDRSALGAWLHSRLPSPWIRRRVPGQARWSTPDRAHLVIGPRQAGKSSLIWRHLAKLGRPVLFVDCELPIVAAWCSLAPLFLADLDALGARGVPIFFEEVQHLEEAGLFLKGLVDRRLGAPLLVTGSSAYHLQSATRESLAGRATRTRLLPLSAGEVLADLATLPPALRAARRAERVDRHLVVGGYPRAWLDDAPGQVLAELVEAFVLRDASDLHAIARPGAFRRLMRLVAGQAGSLVNLSEWSSILGVSRDTVASYLEILVDAHVLARLSPFAGGRRVEVTSRPKVYFLDPGLRHQVLGDLGPFAGRLDRGPVLESWVLGELAKTFAAPAAVHFWRTGSGGEVDFVVDRGPDLIAVEVKAAALRRPSLPRAARSFIGAYRPRALFVVNTGLDHDAIVDGTPVAWRTPASFVEALEGFGDRA